MKKTTHSPLFPLFIGMPAIVWQIIFFYVPLALIITSSVVQVSDTGAFQRLSLEKLFLFATPTYLKVSGATLLLAFTNAVICFLLAYPFAYFLAFKARKYKNLFLFFLVIPFLTNFLLHIYAWFFVLDRGGVINTVLLGLRIIDTPLPMLNSFPSILLMMVYFYLPFMILPLYAVLDKFNENLIESSLDLGASWWQTLRNIILPLSIRGIRSGFFLVFIPSFGEFAIPELMGGDKWMFAGNAISLYILGEQTGSYGAAFTVNCILALIISCFLLYKILNRVFKPRKALG